MSQPDTDKARVADRRSEETRSFVRQVRAATRRKYTPEEKIRIVLEGFRREVTVNDLCRREGIKPTPTMHGPSSPTPTMQSLSQKSELVMGMSLGVPSKRHQLGRW